MVAGGELVLAIIVAALGFDGQFSILTSDVSVEGEGVHGEAVWASDALPDVVEPCFDFFILWIEWLHGLRRAIASLLDHGRVALPFPQSHVLAFAELVEVGLGCFLDDIDGRLVDGRAVVVVKLVVVVAQIGHGSVSAAFVTVRHGVDVSPRGVRRRCCVKEERRQ